MNRCHGAQIRSRRQDDADSRRDLRVARRIGQHRPRWSASSDRAAAPAGRRTAGTVAHSSPSPSLTHTDGGEGSYSNSRRRGSRPTVRRADWRCAFPHSIERSPTRRMTLGFLRGAQRHAQTNRDAPLGAAERLQALLRRKDASLDHSTARLTLGPAIYDFLTGRIREDPSEGLLNYVRANRGSILRAPLHETMGASPVRLRRRL